MGIEQINSAISQMDEVTQQNAALVEEAAAAAASLQEQAATLADVVSVFKVGQDAPAQPVAPPPATRKAASTRQFTRAARPPAVMAGTARRMAIANGPADDWEAF